MKIKGGEHVMMRARRLAMCHCLLIQKYSLTLLRCYAGSCFPSMHLSRGVDQTTGREQREKGPVTVIIGGSVQRICSIFVEIFLIS